MSANPRLLCARALAEWQRGKHFADEILDELNSRHELEPRDRAWLREAFFGTVRHLSQVDFIIDRLKQGDMDPKTRSILRLGIFQLFHMRAPAHAVVNETVELANQSKGFVNAILRRALREQMELQLALDSAPDAIRYAHPEFLIQRWVKQFGREAAIALCEMNNRPAEVYARANGLRVTAGELARSVTGAERSKFHPKSVRTPRLPVSWIRGGLCYVQDPSTLMACDLLDPQPGEQVLDACAAPGGKTTYLAELMDNRGHIIACDLWSTRLEFVQRNVRRLGIRNTHPVVADLMKENPHLKPESFDRILLDAPCSNTGVIRRRVDVRWRLTEEDFVRMPEQQLALIRRVADLLKPGGVLVYSTCSLEREEDEDLVARALKAIPSLEFVEDRRTKPWVDGVDGAYAAKLIKKA